MLFLSGNSASVSKKESTVVVAQEPHSIEIPLLQKKETLSLEKEYLVLKGETEAQEASKALKNPGLGGRDQSGSSQKVSELPAIAWGSFYRCRGVLTAIGLAHALRMAAHAHDAWPRA